MNIRRQLIKTAFILAAASFAVASTFSDQSNGSPSKDFKQAAKATTYEEGSPADFIAKHAASSRPTPKWGEEEKEANAEKQKANRPNPVYINIKKIAPTQE